MVVFLAIEAGDVGFHAACVDVGGGAAVGLVGSGDGQAVCGLWTLGAKLMYLAIHRVVFLRQKLAATIIRSVNELLHCFSRVYGRHGSLGLVCYLGQVLLAQCLVALIG